jgi:type I restriction enzyme S subunit
MNHYPKARLGDLFSFKNGRAFKKEEWTTKGLPIIRIQNLNSAKASFNHFSGEYSSDILVQRGDLLFSWSGTVGSSFGSHLWAGEQGVLNQHIFKVLVKDSIVKRYAYYGLQHITVDIENSVSGAVGLVHITKEKLNEFTLPVPPHSEQHQIVVILDKAFEGIATVKANAERNLQNALEIFESYLKFVFDRRGKGWVEKRLDEICTFSSGGTPSKHNRSYWTGKIPWMSGRDMKSTRLSDSFLHISKAAVEESATRIAPPGTLLILVRGMGLAHGAQIGELMVPSAFNQDIRGIHPTPKLLPRYLLFALRDGINSSDTVLSNAAHGTLKIDSNELQKVTVPFPPREQQQRIVASIDSIAEETARLASIYERQLVALDALKKSLLHHAFAGELTANETSELVEAVA